MAKNIRVITGPSDKKNVPNNLYINEGNKRPKLMYTETFGCPLF